MNKYFLITILLLACFCNKAFSEPWNFRFNGYDEKVENPCEYKLVNNDAPFPEKRKQRVGNQVAILFELEKNLSNGNKILFDKQLDLLNAEDNLIKKDVGNMAIIVSLFAVRLESFLRIIEKNKSTVKWDLSKLNNLVMLDVLVWDDDNNNIIENRATYAKMFIIANMIYQYKILNNKLPEDLKSLDLTKVLKIYKKQAGFFQSLKITLKNEKLDFDAWGNKIIYEYDENDNWILKSFGSDKKDDGFGFDNFSPLIGENSDLVISNKLNFYLNKLSVDKKLKMKNVIIEMMPTYSRMTMIPYKPVKAMN